MTIHRRSVYIWNAAASPGGRQAKRDELLAIGCTQVFVKGFGDDGMAWIEGEALPSFARPQWSDAYAADFAPLDVILWGYPWPSAGDQVSCLKALQARWSHTVVLNPESEWRVQWQSNPWNSLGEANTAAANWVKGLKDMCLHELGRVPSFWLSSCPSWDDFPYEGFMAECDGALPEHYFFERDMAGGEDMVEAHLRRVGTAKPCAPVLTCCGEYDDQGVVDLATLALRDLPHPAGFSGWEAGNTAFQADAMRRAYLLLPEDVVEKKIDTEAATDPIVAHSYINAHGQPVTEIVWAGQAAEVLGTDYVNIGIRVKNAAGQTFHRSILNGQGQQYIEED
jgi:hypothetical protein